MGMPDFFSVFRPNVEDNTTCGGCDSCRSPYMEIETNSVSQKQSVDKINVEENIAIFFIRLN